MLGQNMILKHDPTLTREIKTVKRIVLDPFHQKRKYGLLSGFIDELAEWGRSVPSQLRRKLQQIEGSSGFDLDSAKALRYTEIDFDGGSVSFYFEIPFNGDMDEIIQPDPSYRDGEKSLFIDWLGDLSEHLLLQLMYHTNLQWDLWRAGVATYQTGRERLYVEITFGLDNPSYS